jgi:hypothetical protein
VRPRGLVGEKEGDRRRRGGDEEELLKDGDPRCRGGLRERARIGLRERERCGGSPERDERSLEGVLPRVGETRRAISWTLKDVRCFLWIESEGRIAHASTAAPAIVSRSTIVSNPASHHHGQTSPSSQAREFRQVSACDRALLARGITFIGTARFYFPLFQETLWNARRGSLYFN